MNNKIKLSIIFILILLVFTGCKNQSEQGIEYLKKKNKSELSYLENKILKISSGITFGEFTQSSNESEIEKNENEGHISGGTENPDGNSTSTNNISEQKNNTFKNTNVTNLNQTKTEQESSGVLLPESSQIKEDSWEDVSKELEEMYSAWTVISADLSSLKISNEDITAFGSKLDNAALAVRNKDKKTVLYEIANLSKYIVKFISMYNDNLNENTEKQIKANIISSLAYAENSEWENSANELAFAESEYTKLMNNDEYVKNNSYVVNKRSVLISELKNAITSKNIELYHLKYKYLIEEF